MKSNKILKVLALSASTLVLSYMVNARAQPSPQNAPQTIKIGPAEYYDIDNLPDDHYGRLVRYGKKLTDETYAVIGPEVKNPKMRYAGNNLACSSCHQESGTLANAIPFVGVSAVFPQYRPREDDVSTVEERVNGCMQRSMNGRPLPYDSKEMKAYISYMNFLSKGIPVGSIIEGSGLKAMKPPNRAADPQAGGQVFARNCVRCHGAEGQGERTGKVGDAQGYNVPPLWGKDSFNDGAGMSRLLMAMRFAKHDMVKTLTDDQAYDVAAYVVTQPRPHKSNLEKDFPAKWNKPVDAAFPPYVDGATPEQHKYGPFAPLAEKMKALKDQMQSNNK